MKNDADTKHPFSVFERINRERFKFAIVIVVFLMLAILLFLGRGLWQKNGNPPNADVYSDRQIGLEYGFGYDNLVKRGRFLPITVSYRNFEAEEFKGNISFLLSKENSNEIEARYPVTLAAGEEMSETYYIFLESAGSSLEIKLEDDSKKLVARREELFATDANDSSLIIGVLSDDVGKLDYFNNVSIDYGMLTTKLIDLTPYRFPNLERGLDQLDVVLISNYRIRDLDIEQSRALMNWVDAGGVLIMGTGLRVDDTLGRYAPELLENMYRNPEIREVSLGTYKEAGNIVDELISIPIVDFSIHGGNIVSTGNGMNLVSAVNRNNGLIAVAAYDFCDLSEYAKIHNSFVDDLLVRILGSGKIYELAYDDGVMMDNYYKNDVDTLVEEGNNHKMPPIMWLIFLFTAYLIIISPALFMLLKHFGLSHLYTYSIVILSLFFSYLVYAMGNDTRLNDLSYNYAGILDYSQDNLEERSFLSMRNPLNEPYSFSLSKEYSILPFSNYTESASKSGVRDISIDYTGDRTKINIGYIGGFQSVTLDLKKSAENTEGYGFSGDLKFYNDGLSGEITNEFDFPVEDVTVLLYGKMAMLGDFMAKETKSVEDATILNIPLSETEPVSSMITGMDVIGANHGKTEEYFIARKRNDLLIYFINNYFKGYTVDAKVIGFTDRHMQENMIEPGGLNYFGVNLLTSSFVVDNREGERIFRSALMKSPKIISGEYYREFNMTYTIEPTVLEYDLGEDISVEELYLQHVSDDLKYSGSITNFKGDISILNVYNDNFDLLEPGKTFLNSEELQDYVTPDNHITIRYSHRLESPDNSAALLPMIYVLGTEY